MRKAEASAVKLNSYSMRIQNKIDLEILPHEINPGKIRLSQGLTYFEYFDQEFGKSRCGRIFSPKDNYVSKNYTEKYRVRS